MIPIPRRKPDSVTEVRKTLGDYERGLEADRITVQGMNAAATALGGIANGIGSLGLAAAIPLAAILWGKDLAEIKDTLVEMWPEGGAFLSPEWIAKWGENPEEITSPILAEPDNEEVNKLDPAESGFSFSGLSAYEVYAQVAAGRLAAWEHARNNAVNDWLSSSLNISGVSSLPQNKQDQLMASWHRQNPEPPPLLLFDQLVHQVNIRITAQNNWSARSGTVVLGPFLSLLWDTDPTDDSHYVQDRVIDWVTVAIGADATAAASAGTAQLWNLPSPPNPKYPLYLYANQALKTIETFGAWTTAQHPTSPYFIY